MADAKKPVATVKTQTLKKEDTKAAKAPAKKAEPVKKAVTAAVKKTVAKKAETAVKKTVAKKACRGCRCCQGS